MQMLLFFACSHLYIITRFGPLWKTGSHRATINWKQTTVQNFNGNMIYLGVAYSLRKEQKVHIYTSILPNTKYILHNY